MYFIFFIYIECYQNKTEQKANIEFYFKTGKNATETFWLVKKKNTKISVYHVYQFLNGWGIRRWSKTLKRR